MNERLSILIDEINDSESLKYLPTKELMKSYLLQFCHSDEWKVEREEAFKMIDDDDRFV